MSSIPVITTAPDCFARVDRYARGRLDRPFVHLTDADEALRVLQTELPELFIVDLSDPALDVRTVIDGVTGDPWLFGGGVLALHDEDDEEDAVERVRGANVLAFVSRDRLEQDLPRILDIIRENRRLLFQRVMGPELIPELQGRFVLGNDPIGARCYESLICNFLFNANRIDGDTRDALNFSMNELLLNAIEHGNCGISYEEKSAWLESGRHALELIELRSRDPSVAKRHVTLAYDITPERSRFRITDEGDGFDWRHLPDVTVGEALFRPHGRGLAMTRGMTETLTFNEKGNEVSFKIMHQRDVASATPALLAGLPPRAIQPGEVIFRQGDEGHELLFIARGRYDVIVDGQVIAELRPDDLLMGEMSFLLRSPRNATVVARTEGSVVSLSNERFIDAIRSRPYYALLLARLMAERLQRMIALRTAAPTDPDVRLT